MTRTLRRSSQKAVLAMAIMVAATALPLRPVMAQQATAPQGIVCGPHDKLAGTLAKSFKEKREGIGLTKGGQLMEIYISKTGSWTILMSTAQGKACIIGAGEAWQGRLALHDPET